MMKYQFNKTSMLQIEKDLKIRYKALPVLEAKEAALRLEIKKLNDRIVKMESELAALLERHSDIKSLWVEMPDVISVKKVVMTQRLVAGIKVPSIKHIDYNEQPYSMFSEPGWVPGGIAILKDVIAGKIRTHILKDVLVQMEWTRRKTTQKVNLYKKVQIPGFEEAIRKIKRFLEDEENLSKSSQKVLKNRYLEESYV